MAEALDKALGVDRATWAAFGKTHADKFSVEVCAKHIAKVIDLCRRHGIPVSLGADGAACNNTLDMFLTSPLKIAGEIELRIKL